MSDIAQHADYRQAIAAIRRRIQATQTRAVLAVTSAPQALERDTEKQLVAQITRLKYLQAIEGEPIALIHDDEN